MRARSTRFLKFTATETQLAEVPEGTRFSVYAKRTSGSGTATVGVKGGYKAVPSSDDLFEVQSAVSVSGSAITRIVDDKPQVFTYLSVTTTITGTATFEVYVSGY